MASSELPVEFQALPLEMIVATPLTAAVKAQHAAALATKAYIESFIKDGKPLTIELSAESVADGRSSTVKYSAPLLSIVPIPHLQIDSLSVSFKYEVSQTSSDRRATAAGMEMSASTGAALSPWVSASLKGSLSTQHQEDNTVNRSGSLDITLRASEAPIPAGLDRLLALLARGLPEPRTPANS